jgi:hypothetical protein
MSAPPLGYEALCQMARELGRMQSSLIVLSHGTDPFGIGTPAHLRNADWFAALWREHMPRRGGHLRRLHYRLVSQASPITLPDGRPYLNTLTCWKTLALAGKWARWLDLIDADTLDDKRSPEPRIYLADDAIIAEPRIELADLECVDAARPFIYAPKLPDLPRLIVHRPWPMPVVPQHYHLEIWVEKSDVEDVVLPIAQRYRLNYCPFIGQPGIKPCRDLVERAERSGRPVRLLYISDFDPQGESMPISVARKIEHALCARDLDLDIQVIPLALTKEQCAELDLPRVPIKDGDAGKGRFEERHGEGATELDALEALHPGMLRKIILEAIARYHDDTFDDRVQEAFEQALQELNEEVDALNDAVEARFERELAALKGELDGILAALEPIKEQLKPVQREAEAWRERVEQVYQAIADEMFVAMPDFGGIEWPEPADGDEYPDPLFDSTRSYLEQIDVYKRHQGRSTERRPRKDKGRPKPRRKANGEVP